MMYRKKLILSITLIGLGIGVYFVFQFYRTFFFSNTNFNDQKVFVFIDHDDDIDSLTQQLGPLLKSVERFKVAAVKKGYDKRIKAGKYAVKKGSSNNEIINILRANQLTVTVVFNNQERLENLAGRVAKQIEADSLSLLKAFKDPDFLKQNNLTLENALSIYIPNSYDCYWEITPEDFRSLMLKEYHRFWNSSRLAQAKKQKLTPLEVITLASIVQRETVKVSERHRIAGVYLNRLKKGMKLQACPTAIFALKSELNNYDTVIRRVFYKYLKIHSPYNTYENKGLPPGPICMPDISSIDAVLNPKLTDELYFVADPNNLGYHLFANSLRQHNRNKKKYKKLLNRRHSAPLIFERQR